MYANAGVDANAMVAKVFEALGRDISAVRVAPTRVPAARP
jgi:hypothetical protein